MTAASNRSAITNSLSLSTRFQNGGQYGYCWLCSACEISVYYGGSFVGLEAGHIEAHGSTQSPNGHSLYNCPGGTLDDADRVIDHYTGRTGIYAYNLSASQTIETIDYYFSPIYSAWYYDDGGHAMVIVGYIYNPDTGSFTYILHDSNYINGNSYAYSSYNATSVSYGIGGNNYTWQDTLYRWA